MLCARGQMIPAMHPYANAHHSPNLQVWGNAHDAGQGDHQQLLGDSCAVLRIAGVEFERMSVTKAMGVETAARDIEWQKQTPKIGSTSCRQER